MHRPYLDSFSYRYAESQLENERLRRQIKELNTQVANLKWYNSEIKNEKTKSDIQSAEHSRVLNSKINTLELENSDLKNQSYLKERDLTNDLKVLSSKLNDSNSRIQNLEWLNGELRKEKETKADEINRLSLEKSRLSTDLYRNQKALDEKNKLVDALESRVSHLNNSNFDKSVELQRANKEREELRSEKFGLQARYNTVESLLQKRESEVLDLTKRKQSLLEETIQQQQNIKSLNNSISSLNAEVNYNRSKVKDLENRNTSLLSTSLNQSREIENKQKELERVSFTATVLESEKSKLNSSLQETRRLADNLRESNNDLRLNTLEKERKLQQHEQLFRDMARERYHALEDAKNSAITAERNVELSKLDPISPEYSVVDRSFNTLKSVTSPTDVSRRVDDIKHTLNTSLNTSLNSSTSFSDYYENKFGSPSKSVQAEIERDLKLYRMEQSLNDSLERLRRNLSPKKY